MGARQDIVTGAEIGVGSMWAAPIDSSPVGAVKFRLLPPLAVSAIEDDPDFPSTAKFVRQGPPELGLISRHDDQAAHGGSGGLRGLHVARRPHE
jgi:hypothetical protein